MQFPQNLLNWENGSETQAGNEVVTGIFCGKAGISVNTVSRIEGGQTAMSVEISGR